MDTLCLPLVESLVKEYQGPSLSRVKMIGVQHILETTHSMFRSLYKIGLKPENISIIGKCYSTSAEVYNEMLEDGIDISPASFAYDSYRPFDELFSEKVSNFLSSRLRDLNTNNYDCIIVLDDGGKCIQYLANNISSSKSIIGIEQTSAGYEAIRFLSLPFPVINVARSPVKLNIESPMIAQAAAERLYFSLRNKGILPDRALIIGGGAIGQAMKERLSPEMKISIYDQNPNISDISDLNRVLQSFSLVIGCAGKTSISHQYHHLLSSGTVLVSVSSSDREFDAVYLRKLMLQNYSCHQDLQINDLFLINSGFPVNFDGARVSV